MGMLLAPKFYGLLATAIDRKRRYGKSNLFTLTISVLLETIVSILLAPIFAIYHSTFVTSVFTGKSVQWSAQQRDERGVSWAESASSFLEDDIDRGRFYGFGRLADAKLSFLVFTVFAGADPIDSLGRNRRQFRHRSSIEVAGNFISSFRITRAADRCRARSLATKN